MRWPFRRSTSGRSGASAGGSPAGNRLAEPFVITIPYSEDQLDGPVPVKADLASIEPLVTELIQIGRREGFVGTPDGTYDEHWNHKRAREIGFQLNDRGGMQLMLAAHEQVSAALGASPRGRELEACWGGVGHWMR